MSREREVCNLARNRRITLLKRVLLLLFGRQLRLAFLVLLFAHRFVLHRVRQLDGACRGEIEDGLCDDPFGFGHRLGRARGNRS